MDLTRPAQKGPVVPPGLLPAVPSFQVCRAGCLVRRTGNRKNAVSEHTSQRNMCSSRSGSSGAGWTFTTTIAAPHFRHGVVASFILTFRIAKACDFLI